MIDELRVWIEGWAGGPGIVPAATAYALGLGGLLVVAALTTFVARRLLLRGVERLVRGTEATWDDLLLDAGAFRRAAHLAPGVVVYLLAPAFGEIGPAIQRLALAYIVGATLMAVDAVLSVGLVLYQRSELSRGHPIRGYVQLGKILLFVLGAILILSVVMQRDPRGLLAGLGAMSAVLLLVFRDSILGFVAGLQLASNDMIRRGDWIEMPRYGADGDVIDISLHTVKVQNWDKTITTIPTQALINDAFKNWRGMQESGGRRICRSLLIDMSSIQICDDEMLERFMRFDLIRHYVARKRAEIEKHNADRCDDPSQLVNGRRLTNVGTFRAYVEAYLRQVPAIHPEMTFLVRQLAPTDRGLPIQIYVFSSDQSWARYEAIQADIFDHLIAVAPCFGLRIFQQPSDHSVRAAAGQLARRAAA